MNNEKHPMLEKANEIKMTRLLFFFIALMPMLYVSAQEIKTTAAYQYDYIECLDKNGNIVDEFDCGGIILFADAGRQEWISITIGEEETYTGIVHSKKQESIEETQEFLKKAEAEWQKEFPEFYEFAILTEGAHIGSVCLYLNEDRTEGELGWILNKRYWGHGYTFEAAQALIDYASQNLGIKKFIAYCDSENIPSYSLMEKLGMSRVLCRSGRKNRSSSEERMEYKYALTIE